MSQIVNMCLFAASYSISFSDIPALAQSVWYSSHSVSIWSSPPDSFSLSFHCFLHLQVSFSLCPTSYSPAWALPPRSHMISAYSLFTRRCSLSSNFIYVKAAEAEIQKALPHPLPELSLTQPFSLTTKGSSLFFQSWQKNNTNLPAFVSCFHSNCFWLDVSLTCLHVIYEDDTTNIPCPVILLKAVKSFSQAFLTQSWLLWHLTGLNHLCVCDRFGVWLGNILITPQPTL